ncbi:hypothetical protein TTHERM_00266760 (macronuclear) [Tetrahymena thermophila SB210]|uniref:Transmembrane protein n=1 Tax=Tetrahymena thermophila (strain SB210) TaxID=312017 RepID=I7M180_TETTS|nr:hypothetical protein TTHERM_00266760 [Tetrahymena thermophila SB210]EAR95665.1 hypothetical protein TTHERM_00266760 [Tetrahymena thermophila SB210]|eukprot:XP_001015910.1 hypothetical protein TTHERM_00266760 [Tetrahymena thermophila SB210]
MKQIVKIVFLIFLISQVNCQVTPSLCPNLNKDACNSQQSCQWTQTNEFSCSSPTVCSSLIEADCYTKSSCNWINPINAQCAVKGKYCQLQDNNKCNDEQNCILNPAQVATCSVKGTGFGCQKINDSTNCNNQSECSWTTGFCSNNNNDFCGQITDKGSCTQVDGCQWSQQGNIGSCSIIQNNCSIQQTQNICTGFKACQWNTSSVCLDKPGFCSDPTNCNKDFCNLTQAVDQTCSPNLTKNACLSLNQDSCSTNNMCQYVEAIPGTCNNINQCQSFGFQNQCNSQNTCSWSNVYQCQATGSGSTTYSTKLIGGILVLLLICLSY